jgi:hypothetical protein
MYIVLRITRALVDDDTSIWMENISRDVTGIRASEENEACCNFTWLSRPFQGRRNAKLL